MATRAEDNGGFQDFPQASFAIPSKKELEERVALAFNVKDGQQSSGQSDEDPYSRAVKYVEKHRIVDVFQVTMETPPPRGLQSPINLAPPNQDRCLPRNIHRFFLCLVNCLGSMPKW